MKKLICYTTAALCILCGVISLTACGLFMSEELLEISSSPDGTYTVEAYLTNGGATTDFGIKVYQKTNIGSKEIYYHYHRSKVTIEWQNDSVVVINGTPLDLSKGETFRSLDR
jgi:hypothetical protein